MLKPAAILCKVLQEDDVCVVEAIEAILKTSKAIEKLVSTSFDDLPTVKMVNSRMVTMQMVIPIIRQSTLPSTRKVYLS